jgi:hypothetical protein
MMKIFKIILAGTMLGIAGGASASAVKTVSVSATGHGSTIEEATERALVSAISQHEGVDISSEQVRMMVTRKENGEISINNEFVGATAMRAGGHIESFNVIDSHCKGRCKASVVAYFKMYDAPGQGQENRRRIAVVPFSGPNGNAVTSSVQEALVGSRRFAVLDREHDSEYRAEKRLLLSGDMAEDERLRLGQMLGVDYLLIGEINDTGSSEGNNVNSMTGESQGPREIGSIAYKVIQLATRQIKKQGTVPLYKRGDGNESGAHVARAIIESIYPLKVVSQTPRTLVVNAGEGYVSLNDVYNVYAVGEKLKDPYTGESLGRHETFLGRAVIANIKPKYAEAMLVEPLPSDKGKPVLLRHAKYDTLGPVDSTDALPLGSSGGVILPKG